MAAGIPSVVARRILDSWDSKFLPGEQELLKGLKQTIPDLVPALLDVEKKSQLDSRVKRWLKELEDVLYDADNLLVELSSKALRRRSMTTGNKMANQVRSYFSSSGPKMYQDIRKVTDKLKGLAAQGRELDVVKRSEEVLPTKPDKNTIPEEEVLSEDDEIAAQGRDLHLEKRNEKQILMKPDKNTIVEEVLWKDENKSGIIEILFDLDDCERDVTVLPIVGMRGIGKTTLAQSVFNDEDVQSHFEIRIWVPVSDSFDIIQILTEILVLARATNRTGETLEFELLAKRTRHSLYGKRYLIVLDDVWNEDYNKWISLMEILGVGAKGSRVIITTRSRRVASITGTIQPYNIRILSDEQSRRLFKQRAFEKEPENPKQIEIGEKIAERFRGKPLVITIIASMLRSESSEEWSFFYENELPTILNNDNVIVPALKLCYAHLPSHLKYCFAYCSLFPKHHEFDVQTLIKLWMAQGVIEPSGKSFEDVGYMYLQELLRRSFFHGTEEDARGRVTKFRMHELVHDLAISVAGEQCRMLTTDSDTLRTVRTSHVSIDFDWFSAEKILLFPSEMLRSIILLGQSKRKYDSIAGNRTFEIIAFKFRFLLALDMHALGITTVPHSIGKLTLLKYLDLSENEDIMELPKSITMLLNLQTLKLSSCFGLKKLPRDFRNLVKLRHLELDGCYNLASLPRGIIQLPHLQTLASPNIGLNKSREEVRIKNLGCGEDDLEKYLEVLGKVRSFTLEWESHAVKSDKDIVLQNIKSLQLKELNLHGFRGESLLFQGYLSKLVKLSLWKCVLCPTLSALDQLQHLKVLVLNEVTELKYVSENASSSGTIFPSLQELWLTELPDLLGWWKNGVNQLIPSFACLSKLVIEDCPQLASMPLFPTLEEGLLDTTCWKPFEETLNQKTALQEAPSSSTSTPSLPLCKLKALSIVGIKDFKGDEITWDALKSLQFLRLDCLPNLEILPEKLQHVTSLRELHLWRCGIKEIPEWIGKLQNLEKLVFRVCPVLESVPEAIRELLLLKTLEIEECNTLLRRCEKNIGADWEKISFIKKVLLGRIYA